MSYTISNPSAVAPFYAQVFGEWYSIDPNGSIEVELPEVASSLGQYGALVDDRSAVALPGVLSTPELEADLLARAAAQGANAKTASVPASVADEVARAQQVTTGPEVPTDGVDSLKGAALDDALDAAGLSKSGTVAEKRARYGAWVTEQTANREQLEAEERAAAEREQAEAARLSAQVEVERDEQVSQPQS